MVTNRPRTPDRNVAARRPQVNFYCDLDAWAAFKELAAEEGVSASFKLAQMIDAELAENGYTQDGSL